MEKNMQPTINELWQKRGNFVDTSTGVVIEKPTDGFPVAAGPWPSTYVGARQVRCSVCDDFAGLSPNGVRLHKEAPEIRPIFCGSCFEILLKISRVMEGLSS